MAEFADLAASLAQTSRSLAETELKGFSDLDWKGWFVLSCIACSFVVMVLGLVSPALTMLGETILFMAVGVLSTSQALAGFSSTSVWTVAVMFVVAQGIAGTGGLDYLMSKVLGCPQDVTLGQFRIMGITLLMSSFISDTPVTAVMIPVTIAFAQKARLPQKQLLILVGFAALTGGTNVVIGTSTNLAVSGQMDKRYGDPNSPYYDPNYTGIPIFGLTPYGLPGSFWLMVFCTLLSPLFLTHGQGFLKWVNYFRVGAVDKLWKDNRKFDVTLVVSKDSPLTNMTVDEVGLMDLIYIMPIHYQRGPSEPEQVTRETMLLPGDKVTFAGDLTKLPEIVLGYNMHPLDDDMVRSITAQAGSDDITGSGVFLEEEKLGKFAPDTFADDLVNVGPPRLFTAAVHKSSTIVGKNVAEVNFPRTFAASVLSVRRGKEIVEGPFADVILEVGDQVLLDVGPTFWAGSAAVTTEFSEVRKAPQSGLLNEYMIPMEVKGMLAKPLLAGLTVSRAGLKAVVGGFLVGLQRGGIYITTVADEEVIQMGDVLWFAGDASCLALLRKTPGLETLSADTRVLKKDTLLDRNLVEATIAHDSPLIGKSPNQVEFAERMQAAVLAVRRQGIRVVRFNFVRNASDIQRKNEVGPPGHVVLRGGDTLLVEAGDHFLNKVAPDNPCFSTVHSVPKTTPPKLLFVLVGLVIFLPCFLLFAVWSWRSITTMMGIAASLMMLTRCLSPRQAWQAIDWQILMCIGAAMAVSSAMEITGGAEAIAKALTSIPGAGPTVMLIMVFLTTTILGQILMNTPAAMLVFPVVGIDPTIMAYTIMIAASAVYTTPFGDNINLMTFGAGNYTTWEFVRFGIFVQIGMAATSCLTLAFGNVGKVYIMWIVTGVVFAVVWFLPHLFAFIQWNRERKIRKHRKELKGVKLEKITHFASKKFYSAVGMSSDSGDYQRVSTQVPAV